MINFVISTYGQYPLPLRITLDSILNQTSDQWKIWVVNDGQDPGFDEFMVKYKKENQWCWNQIQYLSLVERTNDYGHSGRDYALKNFYFEPGSFVLMTNGDNYYMPVFVEEMLKRVDKNSKVLHCQMIHSHNRGDSSSGGTYGYFETFFQPCRCDIGAFIVREDVARAVGFNHRHHDADAEYIVELTKFIESNSTSADWEYDIEGINKVLFVHN